MANAIPSTPEEIKEAVKAFAHGKLVSFFHVISATLLVAEIIANFPAEVEHIWMRQWTFMTVLYIIQRYLPLFDSVVVLFRNDFSFNLSVGQCTSAYTAVAWCSILGIMLSEIILTLRVWTVWRRSTKVAVGLVVLFLACWVPTYVFLAQFLGAMEFKLPNLHRGCFINYGSNVLYVCWLMLMVYEASTLTMLLICGVRVYRKGGRTELINAVYRDGIIYYAVLCLFSMINMVIILTTVRDFMILLLSLERILHSLLASRAILHIRQIALEDDMYPGVMSDIQFAQMELRSLPSPHIGSSGRLFSFHLPG